ncbi:amidohydrolase family protein [Rothia sp. AR01]|uniref:Amidohydrolase family protein n=1 Tax=Rothia santali TaxID=2949643 RepID=A0A9X2HE84_9MICC|nr:amidohydrolase family protein [Rothia santali]MCP3425629.1 amidohydrolase family protein [Rothia santali]
MRTLYHSGPIRTMVDLDDAPECVVVEDGRIAFVGDRAAAPAPTGPDDVEVDLAGRTLMPAFIDPHGHFLVYGQFAAPVDLSGAQCVDDVVRLLSERLAAREDPADAPLVGVNYDHNFLRERRHPNRDDLDRVSTVTPVVVMHASVHLGAGNSVMVERAGLTEDTPDPEGGRFGRRPGGTVPDGYVEEFSAIAAFSAALSGGESSMQLVPGADPDPVAAVERAQAEYLRQGITTVQEGAASPEGVRDLIEAGRRGQLALDVVAYPVVNHGGPECAAEHPEHAAGYVDHVRIGGYKMILDGSPQGRSAWLSRPYEEEDGGAGAAADATGGAGRDAGDGTGRDAAHPVGADAAGGAGRRRAPGRSTPPGPRVSRTATAATPRCPTTRSSGGCGSPPPSRAR